MIMSLVGLLFLVSVMPTAVAAHQVGDGKGLYARVYGSALPPYGYVQYCKMRSSECELSNQVTTRVVSTPFRLAELDFVNRTVNKEIAPVEDITQYGHEEFWTIPVTGKGDCEDYVLTKRQRLIARDWPASALLITVVLDENRQGHAVLTARMSGGDLILDNKHDGIKLWSQTPYVYVMRQSYLNPNAWLSLTPPNMSGATLTAGNREK